MSYQHWATAIDDLDSDLHIRGIPTHEFAEDCISFACPVCKAPARARLKSWNVVVMSCSRGCTEAEMIDELYPDEGCPELRYPHDLRYCLEITVPYGNVLAYPDGG
jgi:hypothetical protein